MGLDIVHKFVKCQNGPIGKLVDCMQSITTGRRTGRRLLLTWLLDELSQDITDCTKWPFAC